MQALCASHASAHGFPLQVLEAERAESSALDGEIARLEEDLAAVTSELDAVQQASSGASTDALNSLASLRCEWRKRCRSGYANVVALACSLSVLELEADTPGEEPRKRTCSVVRTCHDQSVDGALAPRVAAC